MSEAKKPQFLKRAAILNAQDIKREALNVPEWGGDVLVYLLTGREAEELDRQRYELVDGRLALKQDGLGMARWAIATVRDEAGKPLFTYKDAADLADKSAAALGRVFAVASRLNGEARVEELAKN